ncbi:MAG: diguanylate cyclase [Magnetococcales bacterium]|nr:diguanylate cyclase [Magnetococcales bacterium]
MEQPKILIVDDETFVIETLVGLLRSDYRIVVAKTGEQGLRAIRADGLPDLILLDIMMPGMDGFEVIRRLKDDPMTRSIPVIFLTALHDVDAEVKGLRLGAVDYISKPFHATIVYARIQTHLGLQRKMALLERMVSLDGLTEIPNRRSFDVVREREWARGLRTGEPLSLIMMDVDQFKQFNDHYGHSGGDRCLQRVARALAGCVHRPGDLVARYGGEEFVAVLSNTDATGAMQVGEQLRQAVSALAIPHSLSTVATHVTISLGVATMTPSATTTLEQLQQTADALLYEAKRQGRNRLCANV